VLDFRGSFAAEHSGSSAGAGHTRHENRRR
jgi:hypothetical protein